MRISHSLSSSRGGEGAVALVRGVRLAIRASWAGGQGGLADRAGVLPNVGRCLGGMASWLEWASVQGGRAGSPAPPPLGPAQSSPTQASQPDPSEPALAASGTAPQPYPPAQLTAPASGHARPGGPALQPPAFPPPSRI